MRRIFLTLALVITAAFGLACTGVGPLGPNGVELTLNAEESVLTAIGAQTQVELELPDDMTTTDLDPIWSSNAPSIASVDENGLVLSPADETALLVPPRKGTGRKIPSSLRE